MSSNCGAFPTNSSIVALTSSISSLGHASGSLFRESSILSIKFRPAAGGFDNAVRIDEEPVAGLQSDLIIGVRNVFHGGHYKTVLVLYDFKGLSFAAQDRIFMSGIGRGEMSR